MKEELWEQLEEELDSYECMCYDMEYMDHQAFWQFWEEHDKPDVSITSFNQSFAKYIPSDAIISIDMADVTADILNNFAHVKDVTCTCITNKNAVGYTGDVKIIAIELADPNYLENLPECERYDVCPKWPIVDFDCGGKKIYVWNSNLEREGFFRKIADHFTNFSEIQIRSNKLNALYEEAPELATTPGITLGLHAFYITTSLYTNTTFDASPLANKYIHSLALYGDDGTFVNYDPDTNLSIGDIVYYDECYTEFVQSLRRSKRTKRAIQ